MLSGQENTAQSSLGGHAARLRLTPVTSANDLGLGPNLRSLRPDPAPRPNLDDLAALRAQIGAIERLGGFDDGEGAGPVSLGAAAVDAALPWGGLPRDCLHEIVGGETAVGFAAGLAARLAAHPVKGTHLAGEARFAEGGAVLWCLRPRAVFDAGNLHGPGLAQFGLDPGRLIIAQARSDQDLLWAMEEGLRSGRPAVVLGEVGEVGLAATRRLQLAAEVGGVTALLLRRRTARRNSSVAVTRWRVMPAPSGDAFPPVLPSGAISPGCWRLDLVRCRGGAPKSWLVEWRRAVPSKNVPSENTLSETLLSGNADGNAGTASRRESFNPAQASDPGGFAVVAELSDRPAEPANTPRQAAAS